MVSNMKLEKMLCMKGGKDQTSYANNSQAQAQHAKSMLHLLKEALDRVQLGPPSTPFVVVDLGCSCGSNTIYIIDVIVNHMAKRYEASGSEPPEFSAFFSDLPSNDFNTLFQLLPNYYPYDGEGGGSMEECLAADKHRSYFAAGVPGTFYRRSEGGMLNLALELLSTPKIHLMNCRGRRRTVMWCSRLMKKRKK